MKQTVLGTAAVLTCCVAASFAQQQPVPTPGAAPAHKVFVLTGCLKADTGEKARFTLTDAFALDQAKPAGSPESSAVGTSRQKVSYELLPISGVDAQGINADALKAHAGQRVEVTVRPLEVVPTPAPNAASPSAQTTKPIESALERFSVTAIKRVTGVCS